MFRVVEKKLSMPEYNGIVEESLKCSIFGVFGKQFKMYQEQMRDDRNNTSYLNHFSSSDILTDENQLFRALLYFNLPFESIIKQNLVPTRTFDYCPLNEQDKQSKNLGNLIEEFEKFTTQDSSKSGNNKNIPSVLLLKVDMDQEDSGEER
jgi:hypothetical protein